MTEDVRRTMRESKKKLQAVGKRVPDQGKKTGPRDTPAGRRLAAMRKERESADEDA